MRIGLRAFLAILSLGVSLSCVPARAAEDESIALKAGETVDLGNLFWVANCKSLLNGPISVEVMDGPPGVTASVKQQKVIPRKFNCANEVPGGRLLVTAPPQVTERTRGTLIVRMKYPTKDGERQWSRTINVTLVP
ncbi:MAG: hypothetical protein ACLP7P_14810 [Rhodomicrobium sp.]